MGVFLVFLDCISVYQCYAKKYQFSKVRFPHSEIDQNLILRSLGGAGGQKCLVHFDKYKKRQKYKHKDKYKDRYTHTDTEKYQIHNHEKIRMQKVKTIRIAMHHFFGTPCRLKVCIWLHAQLTRGKGMLLWRKEMVLAEVVIPMQLCYL